ncbi:inositol monophosphatase family protein [Puniceicoccus vermicola]|uniref:Inositol monophosphatase family protein n=1 Tax=Puniceicoccus vermicola TaxID=388746 RepID=A0A7X1E4F3_9BACT|nr:inositol monophosphatase family protein [Puniceicoccus vermicola]MBC2601999.1 inositol monophosphatase family protein [Puniceicoccus vermicola]
MTRKDFSMKELSHESVAAFLSFAEKIAREVGVGIADRFRSRSFSVENKEDGSPVTEADQEAEKYLRSCIEKEFPEHGIIGEEFGAKGTGQEFIWVIDPIDGTKSFVHGVPLFGTLIGLLYRRRPLVGVIHQPVLDRLASGDNRQAWLNGEQIRVRKERPLSEATLLMTDPSDSLLLERGDSYKNLIREAGVVRSWGDCFGYLSLVMGQADIMIDPILNPWDMLPLLPVLRGAGAVVSDCNGGPPEDGTSLLATTSRSLQQRVLRGLEDFPMIAR